MTHAAVVLVGAIGDGHSILQKFTTIYTARSVRSPMWDWLTNHTSATTPQKLCRACVVTRARARKVPTPRSRVHLRKRGFPLVTQADCAMTIEISTRKIACALALVGLCVPFAMPGLGHGKSAGVGALMKQAITDPLSLLAARSPGQRNDARLVSTKQRHSPVIAGVPEEFVSPHAAMPAAFSPSPQTLADAPSSAFPSPADDIAPRFGQAPGVPLQDGPGPRVYGGGWPGLIIPIGSGGATTPFRPVVGSDTPFLPGIPEPSSWSMLVIGFLLVGARIRARSV